MKSQSTRKGMQVLTALLALAVLLLLATTAPVVRADESGIPERCVEDQHTYDTEADEPVRGSISQRSGTMCTDGTTPSLRIAVPPEDPAVLLPIGSWMYVYSHHAEGVTKTTRSFTVDALCGGTVMCQATVTFATAGQESVAPEETSTSTTTTTRASSSSVMPSEQPVVYPACVASQTPVTYRPGVLSTGTFPMDASTAEAAAVCVYSAQVASQPATGSIVVMAPSQPMEYVFKAPEDTPSVNVTVGYRVLCHKAGALSVACEDTLTIYVHEEAGACPTAEAVFYTHPGVVLNATLQMGATCADPQAEFVAKVVDWQGDGELTCTSSSGLAFSYTPPGTEDAFASATVRAYCDNEPLCETKVVILTSDLVVPTSSSTPQPPSTEPPPPAKEQCDRSFSYKVAVGQSMRGTLYYPNQTECAIVTYNVPRNASSPAGVIDVNIVGDFYYKAPLSEVVDTINVDVHCVATFLCRTQMVFAAYAPLPDESSSLVPSSTVAQLPSCANVYHYTAAPGVPMSSSLNGKPGQDACAYGRYFTLTTPPQGGSLEFMISGDFLYSPARQQGTDEFAFTQFCLGQPYCRGTAYFVVSNEWTLPPSTTTPTSSRPPVAITHPRITCQGTCVEKAWKTYPNPPMWDSSVGAGNVRKDGRAVDGLEVTWGSNALVFKVYAMIGILGARFPTFEPIVSASGTYFEPADFKGKVAATSPGFDMSCLAHQGRGGMGEEVWRWSELGYGSGKGTVGPYYNYGESWYQKFGGKHQECDVFANPCQFAPLLTPANTSAERGAWYMDVDDCDATWTGVFPYATMEKLTKANGQLVWDFVADRSIKGTLISEAARPHSWIEAGRFDALYTEHDIIINLEQFVVVAKPDAAAAPISIDSEFYTYVDENGDEAFGVNMLVYPYVSLNMTSNYEADRHVKGFKWVRQSWRAPDAAQCPTCTGSKFECAVVGQYTTPSYTGDFLTGDCPPGTPRVELTKGPAMTLADCPTPNDMFIYNRTGFSASRNCKPTNQNITFRGVARGSRSLSAMQKRAFNFEGNITLELLMDDDTRQTLDLTLSMYVSRLTQDTTTAEGGLMICRSGSYWPILDPLGQSLPDAPFDLAVATATPLCIDDLSTSYGSSDWALFTLNLPNTKSSEVSVRAIYAIYNGTRIYLLNRNPATGAATIPTASQGEWWQYTAPFLAFRDLSDRAVNNTISVSNEMAYSHINDHAVYAFTFVPGAFGLDTNVEVVVNAVIARENGTATTTFRRMLHVDPLLTQLSRQGPLAVDTTGSKDTSRSDLYAIGATAGVAVAVVITAIFYMIADNNRPLPKWVPRGKLIKMTVLSVLPAGMRKYKKKEKRVVHKDMYDAMNSGKY